MMLYSSFTRGKDMEKIGKPYQLLCFFQNKAVHLFIKYK